MKCILKPFVVLALLCGQNILPMERDHFSDSEIIKIKRRLKPTHNDPEAGPAPTTEQNQAPSEAPLLPQVATTHANPGKDTPILMSKFEEIVDEIKPEFADKIINGSHPRIKRFIRTLTASRLDTSYENRRLTLVGPPGTGKTTMGLIIAKKLGFMTRIINTPSLLSKYQHSGNENFSLALECIALSKTPTVIIVDEIGAIMDKYKGRETDAAVLQGFWKGIDNCARNPNLVLIFTANELVDCPAALNDRIGDDVINIDIATPNIRAETIKDYLLDISKRILGVDEGVILDDITNDFLIKFAKKADKFSNRRLKRLVVCAYEIANDRAQEAGRTIQLIELLPTKNDLEQALIELKQSRSLVKEHKEPDPETKLQAFLKHPMTISLANTLVASAIQIPSQAYFQGTALIAQKAMQVIAIQAQQAMQDKAIESQQAMQDKSLAAQQGMQDKSLVTQQGMQDKSITAQQTMQDKGFKKQDELDDSAGTRAIAITAANVAVSTGLASTAVETGTMLYYATGAWGIKGAIAYGMVAAPFATAAVIGVAGAATGYGIYKLYRFCRG